MIDRRQFGELLLQALETEICGTRIYEKAVRCAVNDDLKQEWQRYLEQTRDHERILHDVLARLDLDADTETPGRLVVRHIGHSLVQAMEIAAAAGDATAAERVAAECVVFAETKDHLNWELIGETLGALDSGSRRVLQAAHAQVEEQEDEHLYHSAGWSRELWIAALGMPAVLPPPEETRDVRTAIDAARAPKARGEML
jgi:hypothetical protein